MKCPVSKRCGGCELLSTAYEKQAKLKQEQVQDLLDEARLKMTAAQPVMAQSAIQYRNKVIYGFAKDKNKKIYSGLYEPGSHRVINTSGCRMQPDLVNEILDEITKHVDSMKIELYSPRTGTGVLRHVLIRYAQKTQEVMVVFVTAGRDFPSRKNMVRALREKFPQIRTILQNINPRDTSVVLQDETMILYGQGVITDELCGLNISFSASSFYQINHDQCEVLYRMADEMLGLDGTQEVLDTYCGVGTIGLVLSRHAKQVMGVEINPEAIENARENARNNHIDNIRFMAMDSTAFMKEARRTHKHFDAIVLDPPRAGTTRDFIESACSLKPQQILYISCDPKTLVRDLVFFKKNGYVSDEVRLVDMFPNTKHIESVVLLTPSKAGAKNALSSALPKGPKIVQKKTTAKAAAKPKQKKAYEDLNPYEKALLELKRSKKNKKR